MGVSQALCIALSLVFASLMLLATTHAFASAEQVSNSLQTSQSYSIQITLSKQASTAISLEARAAPLGQILKAIATKTGVNIHYSVLPETPVTATCVGANIGQVMDCLVAKQVGLVAHKPQKDKPAEFWLLGSSVGSCQAVTVAPEASPVQVAVEQKPELAPETPKRTKREQSDALLAKLKDAKSAQERTEALANLATGGIIGDPDVRKALDDAILDTDANTRAQAISTLANLDREGAAEVLAGALHDSDATVRLTAVDQLSDDVEVLKQALADSDTGIREFATAKLAEIKKREDRKIDQMEE